MSNSEIILAKLQVDDRRRILVNKEGGKLLDLQEGDGIVLSHEAESGYMSLRIQRRGQIVRTWVISRLD